MVGFFTQLGPKHPLGMQSKYIIRNSPRCLTIVKGQFIPYVNDTRNYTEGGSGKVPSKQEKIESMKLPGFVHQEAINEEGYFTQKAKKQLEELKRRMEKKKIAMPKNKE